MVNKWPACTLGWTYAQISDRDRPCERHPLRQVRRVHQWWRAARAPRVGRVPAPARGQPGKLRDQDDRHADLGLPLPLAPGISAQENHWLELAYIFTAHA